MNYKIALLFLFFSHILAAQTIGPKNGKLMIVGGGPANDLIRQFVRLAGGKDAVIVVIPTAGTSEVFPDDWEFKRRIEDYGAKKVTVLHTRDPKIADTEDFVQPLKDASGIWFPGGRQWRLVDAYMNTKVVDECWNLLERGGIIGGSSAGATIQGSYLARGDTESNTVMMGDHEEGFAFVQNVAIDQHLLARNRQFDLLEIIKAKPHLLGIGLDESTAILVEGNQFEVIGKTYVAVYDGNFWRRDGNPAIPKGESFYLLRPGDKYDMEKRNIVKE